MKNFCCVKGFWLLAHCCIVAVSLAQGEECSTKHPSVLVGPGRDVVYEVTEPLAGSPTLAITCLDVGVETIDPSQQCNGSRQEVFVYGSEDETWDISRPGHEVFSARNPVSQWGYRYINTNDTCVQMVTIDMTYLTSCPIVNGRKCNGHGQCVDTEYNGRVCKCVCTKSGGCWNGRGGCEECDKFHFGPDCMKQISCPTSGICGKDSCWGQQGDGTCSGCLPGFFGPTCERVTCYRGYHGICEEGDCWGRNATGKCTACKDGFWGENCAWSQLCQHGKCLAPPLGNCSGIHGTGWCDECNPGYYGRACGNKVTCPEDNGICESPSCSGIHGNGLCSDCKEGWFGRSCRRAVQCDKHFGICDNKTCSGPDGSGLCSNCTEYHFTPSCDWESSCDTDHGVCLPGTCWGPNVEWSMHPLGPPCDECDPSYYGAYCKNPVRCNTTAGVCNYGSCSGPTGTGLCDSCNSQFYSPTCAPVKCKHGICIEHDCWGLEGNGLCTECDDETWFGQDCASKVTCNTTNGECGLGCSDVTGNGRCRSCREGSNSFGPNCVPVTCDMGHGHCSNETDAKGLKCSGILGDGHCTECISKNRYGVDCDKTVACRESGGYCTKGKCSGKLGDGNCDKCKKNHYGNTCKPVTCHLNRGACKFGSCWGVDATGHCTTCNYKYSGWDCDMYRWEIFFIIFLLVLSLLLGAASITLAIILYVKWDHAKKGREAMLEETDSFHLPEYGRDSYLTIDRHGSIGNSRHGFPVEEPGTL